MKLDIHNQESSPDQYVAGIGAMEIRQTVEIRVRGTVQGVGFRPTVWRLACDEGLVGEVFNDGFGVLIRTTGRSGAISQFLSRLHTEAPPLSQIEKVETQVLNLLDFEDFRIAESVSGENFTRVTPDAAICGACRAEVLDPKERRYGYPFANCTHCGPRFSIVREVPYDRANTTMADFPMCAACKSEYLQPADRRFHAQPIACPTCGPSIWLELVGTSATSAHPTTTTTPLDSAIELLKNGAVVAIRGLGGFHLACDATNSEAVQRLRQRKHRYGKPFALMARDLNTIRRYCLLTPAETNLLQSPEAPIVLLAADGAERLSEGIAPGLNTVGFMLPYTPLHLLIMRQIDRPLVMTSGNVSDEPQVTSLDTARTGLRRIADAMLMHNREIANRIDDSVVRIVADRPAVLRRARGYAPSAVSLPPGFGDAPDLVAYGGELKATFCVVKDGAAILSQHQGDLEDVSTFEDYQKNLQLYSRIYDHRPRLLVADMHPEYLSAKLAKQRAADDELPLLKVQHHHAHIASCMVENGVALDAGPVLGIAIDGLGFGDDGTIWGGEFLLADYYGYRRVATFKPVAMIGGVQAIREPWRNTYAHLVAGLGWTEFVERFSALELCRYLKTKPLATIDRMLATGLNVPLASSCGRLFDAVAAALGLCADQAIFEGQGAMELEALAEPYGPSAAESPYPFTITAPATGGLLYLDSLPMWQALLEDLDRQTPVPRMAARFHYGLARAIRDMVTRIRSTIAAGASLDRVALSGGCFQNKFLLEELVRLLEADGLSCLLHAKVPTNDGGLALGQAAIAAAGHIERSNPANLRSSASNN
ncbi:MAG TPA: carbamoyltransferase HypF [Pyrinomonadaceae bacterium]|nr:carbamoyltransferase HypF [Pyrinomonadaceae bacterium]